MNRIHLKPKNKTKRDLPDNLTRACSDDCLLSWTSACFIKLNLIMTRDNVTGGHSSWTSDDRANASTRTRESRQRAVSANSSATRV